MRILEAVKLDLQLADIRSWHRHPEPKIIRPAGIHLSGVLKVMATEFGLLKDIPEEDFEEQMPLRMILGLGWERLAAGFYPTMRWQPGSIERDGITGSPDGNSPWNTDLKIHRCTGNEMVIDEFKRTRKSCRDFDLTATKNKLWIWQTQGYCCQDPRRPTRVRFHILFVEGNYSRGQFGMEEQYWRYVIEYSREELDKFWPMVLRFKDKAIAEVGNENE